MIAIASRGRSAKAFTLVELMVVVAIIALLISILLPSLAKARGQAFQVKCAAHLSSIFKGFFYYADDNSRGGGNGYIPNISTYYRNIGFWPNQIARYVSIRRSAVGSRQGLFRCPAHEDAPLYKITGPNAGSEASVAEKIAADHPGGGSSNPFATGGGGGKFQEIIEPISYLGACSLARPHERFGMFPPKLAEIDRPHCFPILTEASPSATMCFRFEAFSVESRNEDMRRHYGGSSISSNGVNLMFADGHVQWHSQEFVATKLICCIDTGPGSDKIEGATDAVQNLRSAQRQRCGK